MNRFSNVVLALILLAFPLMNRLIPTFGPEAFDQLSDVMLLPLLMVLMVLVRWRAIVTAIQPGPIFYLLCAWAGVGVLSALSSDWPALAIYRQAYGFLAVFFVLALAQSFREDHWPVAKVFKWLCLGGLIYLSALWLYIYLIAPSDGFAWVYNVPGFPNARFLGFFAVAFVVAAHVLVPPKDAGFVSRRGLLALGVLALAWSLLFWSGGRAPVLAFVGGLGIMWLYGHGAVIRKLVPYTGLSAMLGAGLSLLYQVPSTGMGVFRLAERASRTEEFSSGRASLWADTFESILNRPVIGHGADVLPFVLSGPSSYLNHPHNFPLQFVHSWGLLGGGALMLALALMGHRLLSQNAKTDSMRFIALLGMLVFALGGLVDGTFYHPLIFLYGAVFFASALSMTAPVKVRPLPLTKPLFAVTILLVVGVFLRHGQSVMVLGNEHTPPMTDSEWATLMSFPSPMSKHGASFIVGMNLDRNIKDGHQDIAPRLAWATRWARGGGSRELMLIRHELLFGDVPQATTQLNVFYCRHDAYVRHMVKHMVNHMGVNVPVCDEGVSDG